MFVNKNNTAIQNENHWLAQRIIQQKFIHFLLTTFLLSLKRVLIKAFILVSQWMCVCVCAGFCFSFIQIFDEFFSFIQFVCWFVWKYDESPRPFLNNIFFDTLQRKQHCDTISVHSCLLVVDMFIVRIANVLSYVNHLWWVASVFAKTWRCVHAINDKISKNIVRAQRQNKAKAHQSAANISKHIE